MTSPAGYTVHYDHPDDNVLVLHDSVDDDASAVHPVCYHVCPTTGFHPVRFDLCAYIRG